MSGTFEAMQEPLRVRIEALSQFHAMMVRFLTEAGLTGSQLSDLFSVGLRAECELCKMPVRGEELIQVALASGPLPNAGLNRLRLGYCARADCRSYYYLIRLEGNHGLDWQALGKALEAALAPVANPSGPAAIPQVQRRRFWPFRGRSVFRVGLALGLVLSLLVMWRTRSGHPLPFRPANHKYQLDPSSVHGGGR